MANLEEKLREAACLGDLYALRTLLSRNVNVNSQNIVNGWTALHWAVKRGHEDAVKLLLQFGADSNIVNNKGEKPLSLSTKPNISKLLGKNENFETVTAETKTDFIPGYILHPPLFVDLLEVNLNDKTPITRNVLQVQQNLNKSQSENDLIIRARIKNSSDKDYIEFEMLKETATYQSLLNKCCEELEIQPYQVVKIKKGLVRIRNDADVKRFPSVVYLNLFVKEN